MRFIKDGNWSIPKPLDGALHDFTDKSGVDSTVQDDADEQFIFVDSDDGNINIDSQSDLLAKYPETDNIVNLEDDELSLLDSNIDTLRVSFRKALLGQYAASQIAFDSAASQTTAVLRDHLSIDSNINDSFLPVLNTVGSIEVLRTLLDASALLGAHREQIFDKISSKLIDSMVVTKGKPYSKYSNSLDNLGLGIGVTGSGTRIRSGDKKED